GAQARFDRRARFRYVAPMRIALVVLVVTLMLPRAARSDDGPAPGQVVDQQTVGAVEALLLPEIAARYKAGEFRNQVAAWPKTPPWEDAFEAASQKNADRYTVDEHGTIVERGSGKPARDVYGVPFRIDAKDAAAGVQVMWNAYYALWRVAGTHDVLAMD